MTFSCIDNLQSAQSANEYSNASVNETYFVVGILVVVEKAHDERYYCDWGKMIVE